MSNAWMAKLAHRSSFSEDDRVALAAAQSTAKTFEARDVIASEGDPADAMIAMLSGWAACGRILRSGERQIVCFLIPGDFTRVYPGVTHRRSDRVWALTRCNVAEIHTDVVEALGRERPTVDRAFRRSAMVDSSISQEWLTNLGRRSAERRLAHLFCELFERLRVVGLASKDRFPLPITQVALGDALGLSPAHVNRTLQSLRACNLARFEGGVVTIGDSGQLRRFSGFSSNYLDIAAELQS